MRPLRLLLSLCSSLLAIIIVLYIAVGSDSDAEQQTSQDSSKTNKLSALFSFTSPASLFPPSAIISLTDDNSTFFLARPAAFGPLLPGHGLSGPLWIGGGFGDDAVGGELGCSDVPDWDDDDEEGDNFDLNNTGNRKLKKKKMSDHGMKLSNIRRKREPGTREPKEHDGTDDLFHRPLHSSKPPKYHTGKTVEHADIQSLQEGAEISGKVVLLKRGGCGFLEKVKWAQRREAVALIVGDDVRGGALIRMYAKGDTSDVAIPALFTSYTTAHLLSSLMPSDGVMQDLSPDDAAKLALIKNSKERKNKKNKGKGTPNVKHTTGYRPTSTQSVTSSVKVPKPEEANYPPIPTSSGDAGWVTTLLETLHMRKEHRSSSRQGSNGPVKSSVPSMQRASSRHESDEGEQDPDKAEPHEGLWVTLTPTNMSSSPFFDTLLVLVVSPLVTLTVVYALLLLRSRIRRRRWRAPKSVVERLPVRTYHTISDDSPTATPAASSPTTPLLQRTQSRPTSSQSQPRSQMASDIPGSSSSVHQSVRSPEEEKREAGLAEWRRRYGGRQRECVVCLEEYVDGVSKVMSLPCGHEFHVDCITPWLVTRRRTCPICKGDVVRSLSQSYSNRSPLSPSPTRSSRVLYDDLDELQIQAAETRNDSPSASRPVPIASASVSNYPGEFDTDIEANRSGEHNDHRARGREISRERSANLSGSFRDLSSTVATTIWRGFEAVRGATGLQARSSREEIDRDR